jgi:hypothetical protein
VQKISLWDKASHDCSVEYPHDLKGGSWVSSISQTLHSTTPLAGQGRITCFCRKCLVREPGVTYFSVRCVHGSFGSPTHRKQIRGCCPWDLILTDSIGAEQCRPRRRTSAIAIGQADKNVAGRRRHWTNRGVGRPSSMPQKAVTAF